MESLVQLTGPQALILCKKSDFKQITSACSQDLIVYRACGRISNAWATSKSMSAIHSTAQPVKTGADLPPATRQICPDFALWPGLPGC